MAHDEDIRRHRRQVVDRVEQRFALRRGRGRDVQVDDVRRQSGRGDLEGGAGPGRVLEEEVEDRAAPQQRHLLHVPVGHVQERRRVVEDPVDHLARQALQRQEMLELAIRAHLEVLHSVPYEAHAAHNKSRSPSCRRGSGFAGPLARAGGASGGVSFNPEREAPAGFLAQHEALVAAQRHDRAEVVCLHRQFAAAAVEQHREFHPGRPAEVEDLVQRRADGAAGVEDVVDQDDVLVLDRKVDRRRLDGWWAGRARRNRRDGKRSTGTRAARTSSGRDAGAPRSRRRRCARR